jgi:predicted DNA-binding transcriptional regulator AlpA
MARAKVTDRAPTPHAEPKKKKRTARPHAPVPLRAYSIPQFCEAYNMSVWTYYRIAKDGIGPKIRKVGSKTLIGIADAEAWFEKRKAPAKEQRAEREAASAEA